MAEPGRLYHYDLYDWSRPVPSYWEAESGPHPHYARLEGEISVDVAVIGGGYTGMSAAYHLARDHGISVAVVEAGPIGWGASGRNGGFACLSSSALSIDKLIKRYGKEETLRFYAAQLEGFALVKAIAEAEGFSIDPQGDGILTIAHKPSRFKELEEDKRAMALVGIPTRLSTQAQFAQEYFDSKEQFGGLWTGAGFGLNPLKYVRGLAAAAVSRGVQVFGHSHVSEWKREGDTHVLSTLSGAVRAKSVVVAANAWMPEELQPALAGRVLAVMSNIVTTRPMTDDELAAQSWKTENPIYNTRDLLFYFRMLPDKRLLFGGRGDTVGDKLGGERMRDLLDAGLKRLFPAWAQVPTTHYWRGLIAITERLTPSIGRLDEDRSVHFSFGCHGNGVGWSTWAGRALAGEIAGKAGPLPAPVRGMSHRFVWPQLRMYYLRAALGAMQVKDSLF